MNTIRFARQRAIERQIKRLERRLVPLQILSDRVSWIRVGVFLVGVASAWSIGSQANWLAGSGVFLFAVFLFGTVVWYHRRLERWIDTFAAWRALRADQLARMTHDWERLPNDTITAGHACALARDLDLTGPRSLHQLLDTTQSCQASQLLAEWLVQHHLVLEQIHVRQDIVRELVAYSRLRDRFRLIFRLVLQERLEGEKLVRWLSVTFQSHRFKWALPIATALIALNWILVALDFWGGWSAYWTISLALYAAFYFLNLSWLTAVLGALLRMESELDHVSAILNYLEQVPLGSRAHLARLCAPLRDAAHPPSAYLRRIKLTAIGVGLRSNLVLGLVLNLIAPWDFLFAFLTDRCRAQVIERLPVWLQVCYKLDASIALANFAYVNPECVFPDITPNAQPLLTVKELGHPLIPSAQSVRNDFEFNALGELAIITGSNMAGKSTFLKAIGINLCLAYAGAPVVAAQFRAHPFRLHTCIRIADSVTDGFSYFYAEVKCLKRLLEELKAENALPLLYLIDEIFRGTNNRERLLGSRAYIQVLLSERGIGLVATHDLELAALAEKRPQVQNYHFRDDVAAGKLVFDYKIRPGACSTTNALKIMEMEGLPIPSNR